MRTEWKKCKIGDLGDVVTGKTPPTKHDEYWNGGIPFVTPVDLQQTKHILSTERYITKLGKEKVKSSILPKNSVCVSCIGNIGYLGVTTEESISNQQINSIVVNDNNDSEFVYYLLKSLWRYFKNYEGQSTTVSILNKSQFSKLEVTLPPLPTQQKIAAILSALDAKIENNNAINRNLEQQAQALFKSWFVDFEPFGGKMPEGWRVGKAEEIIEIHDGKRVPLSNMQRAKLKKIYPYYGATSIMDYVDDYLFDGIFLLFAEDGTVITKDGNPVLQYVEGKFWVNNHAHILTGKNGFSTEMLWLVFYKMSIKSIVTGAVQPKISQGNLKQLNVVIPTHNILCKFDDLIQPMFEKIRMIRQENARLAALRDTLLPKLMSGEIEV